MGGPETAQLLLGPILRYADGARATIWLEADRPCEVEVLGQRRRTFAVEGHHFAVLRLDVPDAGEPTPYEVALDGRRVWPEAASDLPPSTLPAAPGDPTVLAFGSCRTFLDDPEHPDALRALALRASRLPGHEHPDALVLLGDQIYDSHGAPATRTFIRGRRDTSRPPGCEPADFEEYTRLYREAWSEPAVRWLLSTVPTVMIFDDHDVIDGWNSSQDWVAEIRRQPWWAERVTGALMAYWLYQHVGNLTPAQLDADDLLARLESGDEGALRAGAATWDTGVEGTTGSRWCFARDVGSVHLVVVDTRCGKVLAEGARDVLDAEGWAWLEARARSTRRHLVIGTTLPVLLPAGLHRAEGSVTALRDGAWGRWAAAGAERLRQAAYVNHWAAFPTSFARMSDLLAEVAGAPDGPASVTVLSGDVHFGYVARLTTGGAPVHQVVSSPLCHDVDDAVQRGFRFATSRAGALAGRLLGRLTRVPEPARPWELRTSPVFGNVVGVVSFGAAGASVRLDQPRADGADLVTAAEHTLDGVRAGGVAEDAAAPAPDRHRRSAP